MNIATVFPVPQCSDYWVLSQNPMRCGQKLDVGYFSCLFLPIAAFFFEPSLPAQFIFYNFVPQQSWFNWHSPA